MPLLIEKVLGFGGALFVLIALVAFFGYVVIKSFYIFLTGEKRDRLPSILIFYMSCSSIIQIILSTLEIEINSLIRYKSSIREYWFTAMILPCLTYGSCWHEHDDKKNRPFQMIYSKVLVNRFLIVLILCILMLLITILYQDLAN